MRYVLSVILIMLFIGLWIGSNQNWWCSENMNPISFFILLFMIVCSVFGIKIGIEARKEIKDREDQNNDDKND